ncbi:hypothetical protein C8J57DRAFT_1376248 [Mycena rebaudengoi]|nr:hypothetical protein C8J57DRAFT_1376248 [Mycena rebaudengoi]
MRRKLYPLPAGATLIWALSVYLWHADVFDSSSATYGWKKTQQAGPREIPIGQISWKYAPDGFEPPDGVGADDIEIHARPNLLLSGLTVTDPVQIIAHRGLFANAAGVPENTWGSYEKAVAVTNLLEVDVVVTSDKHIYCAHDWNTKRVSLLGDRFWSHLHSSVVDGEDVVIRNFKAGKFTNEYIITGEKFLPLELMLLKIFSVNPAATVFLDARFSDSGDVVKWIMDHSEYSDRVVVFVHTFSFIDGAAFSTYVDSLGTPHHWRTTVAVVPVLIPSQLPTVAAHCLGAEACDSDYYKLYDAGLRWIASFQNEKLRVFAFALNIAGSGLRFDPSTGLARNLFGEIITDPQAVADFSKDRVLIDLSAYLFSQGILSCGVCRTYDVKSLGVKYKWDIMTGEPVQWPAGAREELFYEQSIPGGTHQFHNIIISDRLLDSLTVATEERQGKMFARSSDSEYPVNDAD